MHRIILLLATGLAVAETQTWEHTTQADFEKATLDKLSLRSDGRLMLAPVWKELYDASANYLWTVAEDSRGNIWTGGSGEDGKAKLYRIDASGTATTAAELDGLEIHAIAIDRQDRVYAGTAPGGKIYRIEGTSVREFYDPKATYIWAMAFAPSGDLFVATGGKGELHRVTPAGQGSVFFSTEEAHARSLAIDAKGNVYVGTEPGGLVLRVSPTGQGFVVHQTGKREVTAIAASADGTIWAAAAGAKQPAASSTQAPPSPPTPPPAAAAAAPPGAVVLQAQAPPSPPPPSSAGPSVSGGSEVVRVEPDGYAHTVWSHPSEIVYAIALDRNGRPLIGTGNRGNIYRLDSGLLATLVLSAKPTQITALATGARGRVLAATGNIGKVFQLGPDNERQGSIESTALDAGFFSYWGRMGFRADLRGGKTRLATRSGNLDTPRSNWSPWADVELNSHSGRIGSPPARFLQYKVTIEAAPSGDSPELSAVDIAWLPRNVPPKVEVLEATPPNYRFPPQSLTLTPSRLLTLPPLVRPAKPAAKSSFSTGSSASMNYAKGYMGARWLANDGNGDELRARLEIRGEGESNWRLLVDDLKDAHYSWDSTAFPDGEYRLRVTVTDSPSNPPAQALTGQLESDPFTIDNSAPRISSLAASRTGAVAEIKWRAEDGRSVISKAEYSVDGKEWLVVQPTTRLSDSTGHDYLLRIEPGSGEHTVAVRVTDTFDNQTVEKVVVK